MEEMTNILIVGNGFDLSHFLPTKYDHFMAALESIEKWDIQKGQMRFDDIFEGLYKKEECFLNNTKKLYDCNVFVLDEEKIKKTKQILQDNVWYKYFSHHVKLVKSWIDFETKIEEALKHVFLLFEEVSRVSEVNSLYSLNIQETKQDSCVFLNKRSCQILYLLGILDGKFYKDNTANRKEVLFHESWIYSEFRIRNAFIINNKRCFEFQIDEIEKFIRIELDQFSWLFNQYLLQVENLSDTKSNDFCTDLGIIDLKEIDQVYSFNYTSTFQRLYTQNTKIDYLHGNVVHSRDQLKIVLGIAELDDLLLQKYNFWGFIKCHQKMLKNTDYVFLNENTSIIKNINYQMEIMGRKKFFNFYIWGHSLDRSDQEYIKELFSLNSHQDRYVRVIIFSYDQAAKFSHLANLLKILGKPVVELWMKNKWLRFEENPNILSLNNLDDQ